MSNTASPATSSIPVHTDVDDDTTHRGLHDWPFRWMDAGRLAGAWLALSALWVLMGLAVTGVLDDTVGANDRRVATNMVADRTQRKNDLSHIGTLLAETGTKIVVTIVLALVILAVWRRWADVMVVCGALVLEASTFLTVTLIVGRHRPEVDRLDSSPVDSSFPSGHVAAAVVYGALVVVLWRHRHRAWAVAAGVLVTLVALAVAWSRMYRGMHYLSDVIAGALLGLVSVAIVAALVARAERRATLHEHTVQP